MGIFDDAVPGGNISKPLMIALGALLIGKLVTGGSHDQGTAPQQNADTAGGGLLGGLGGLLDKLKTAGHGESVDSWVQPGQNKPIEPGHLGAAIGSQTISDLAKHAGISEQELIDQLSKVLPGVVDKLTPDGKIPSTPELATLLQR